MVGHRVPFLVTFLHAVGFVGDVLVPKSVDAGDPAASPGTAVAVNLLLLGLFAVQHSVMARKWFKERWTKLVPWHLERSTYVVAATSMLALLTWQWRPIPEVVWSVEKPLAAGLLEGVFWAVVSISTFLVDHFELFGLEQVSRHFRRGDSDEPERPRPAAR